MTLTAEQIDYIIASIEILNYGTVTVYVDEPHGQLDVVVEHRKRYRSVRRVTPENDLTTRGSGG